MQALFNGSLELRLRLWSPAYGGYYYGSDTVVAVRVRSGIIIRIRTVRIRLRGAGPGLEY